MKKWGEIFVLQSQAQHFLMEIASWMLQQPSSELPRLPGLVGWRQLGQMAPKSCHCSQKSGLPGNPSCSWYPQGFPVPCHRAGSHIARTGACRSFSTQLHSRKPGIPSMPCRLSAARPQILQSLFWGQMDGPVLETGTQERVLNPGACCQETCLGFGIGILGRRMDVVQ